MCKNDDDEGVVGAASEAATECLIHRVGRDPASGIRERKAISRKIHKTGGITGVMRN